MAHGRWYPTVTMLGDGRVMTFSGTDENGSTNNTVEILHGGLRLERSSAASWTPPLYPRMHLLPNGKVFYSGPQRHDFAPFRSVEHQTWTERGSTNMAATGPMALRFCCR